MLYVELDKADPILDDVLMGLSNKQPKIIAATLAALTALYHAYGAKIVEPKPTLKALPKLFGHADKNVRAEASNLTVELYRWLRTAMKKLIWDELKPVQQQDLEKLFTVIDSEPSPKQERLLRTQQAEAEAAAAAGDGDDDAAEEVGDEEAQGEVEVFDLAEPKDVIGQIPHDFYDNMASAKWKDRKEALDALYPMVNTEKIKDGHFEELVAVLAKSMKDANIAVVTTAAATIEALAKGLRKSFAKYRSKTMSPIMERLKEKKQSVTDALGAALDAVFASSSFSDCLEDILEFLKHKNPNVKAETLSFLIRCLKATREVPAKTEAKSIADAATKLLTESVEATRSGGAEVLGTLMKIIGERAMNPYMEGLDDIRKTKIKEYCDRAEVKAKDKPKPVVAAPTKATGAPTSQKRPVTKKTLTSGSAHGLKPSIKRASTPQAEKASSPPSKLAAASKSIPSKFPGGGSSGGLSKPGLTAPSTTGLKKKLHGAGPPPVLPSPRRTITPHSEEDNAPTATGPPPRLGRGLAGRPLGKPSLPSASNPQPAPSSPRPAASATQAEIDDLRSERDRFARFTEDLRADKARLTAQIHELQNHNAELIEDHTRDVLSIKAKETQLVRARSDAEAAEANASRLQRENDRLKRELSRSLRTTSQGSPLSAGAAGAGSEHQIFRDSTSSAGTAPRPTLDRYDSSHSHGVGMGTGGRSSRYLGSPSEEKENGSLMMASDGAEEGYTDGVVKSAFGGRPAAGGGRTISGDTLIGGGRAGAGDSGGGGGGGDRPMADWKRAGEVTSQLKARIEQMKVCLTSFFIVPSPASLLPCSGTALIDTCLG